MINLSDNIWLIIIAIAIIYIWRCYNTWTSSNFRELASRINHDQIDANTAEMVTLFDRLPNPTALDFYYMGSYYTHNLKKPEQARHYYNQAATEIRLGDTEHVAFIEEKLRDEAQHMRTELADVEDYELLLALANSLETAPRPAQPIVFVADNQNVHDRAVVQRLTENYMYLKFAQDTVYEDLNELGIEAVQKLEGRVAGNKLRALQRISDNATLLPLTDAEGGAKVGERDLLGLIVAHIDYLDKPILLELLAENLEDCVDDSGAIVCSGGRAARLMSTFAYADPENPDLGLFKSKQIMRNEVMNAMTVIRAQVLNTPEKQADYNADNQRGKELTQEILSVASQKIRNDYPASFHSELMSDVAAAI